jgi:multiple sugar transport system substrate-binding protein
MDTFVRGSHGQTTAQFGVPRGRQTRRVMLGAGAASIGGLLAIACGQAAGTTTQPSGGTSAAPVTVRFAADKPRFDAGVQAVIDAFNAKGGPVRAEADVIAGTSVVEKILAQSAAGDTPDLAHTHPRDYHAWVNAGALIDLDAYLKKDRGNVPDIVPTALDYWSRDGHRWAMPNNLSIQNIYFNKQIFEQRGLKTPDQYEKEGKWTFDTYLDLGRQLTFGTGETKTFGATWIAGNLDIQLGFLWPFGADLWDAKREKTLLDSKEALEAIQFQADLTAKYGAAPTVDEFRQYASVPSNTWGAAFSAGRAAIELQPNDSLLPHVIAATFPKGMAPMPKGRAGRVVRGLAVGAHILKGSKKPDAAWEFANYQSGKESEKIMLELHVTLPWHKSSIDNLEKTMPLLPFENGAYYAEGVRRLRVTPYVPKFSDINKLYADTYLEVRHGRKTATQMLTEIKPQIETWLKA